MRPTQFLKEMDLTFQVRDRWDVVGSKIKQGNSVLILSKEIRRNGSTLYIREDNGEPMWKSKAA